MGSAVNRSPACLVCGSADALDRLIRAGRLGLAFSGVLGFPAAAFAKLLIRVWRLERINARLEFAAPVERNDFLAQRTVDNIAGPSLTSEQVKARKMNANAPNLKLTPTSLSNRTTAGVLAGGKLAIGARDFQFQRGFRVNNGKAVNLLVLHCHSPYGPALGMIALVRCGFRLG